MTEPESAGAGFDARFYGAWGRLQVDHDGQLDQATHAIAYAAWKAGVEAANARAERLAMALRAAGQDYHRAWHHDLSWDTCPFVPCASTRAALAGDAPRREEI